VHAFQSNETESSLFGCGIRMPDLDTAMRSWASKQILRISKVRMTVEKILEI
jgi:hypothetical protein